MYTRQSNQQFDQFMKFQQQQWEQFQQFYQMQNETHAPSNYGRFERGPNFPRQALEAQPGPFYFGKPAIKHSQPVPHPRRPVNNVNYHYFIEDEDDFEEEFFETEEDIFSMLLNAFTPQNVKPTKQIRETPKQHKKTVQTQNPIFKLTIPEAPLQNNTHPRPKPPTAEKPVPNRRVNVPEARASQSAFKPGCFRVNIPANAAPVKKNEANAAPARRCAANAAPAPKAGCFRVNIPANVAPARKCANVPVRPSEPVKKPVENSENGLKEFQKIREEFNEVVSELRTAEDSKFKFYENKLMKMLLQIDETACSPQVRPLRKLLVTKINTCLDFLQEKLNPKPVADANEEVDTSEYVPVSQSDENQTETSPQSDSTDSATSLAASEAFSPESTAETSTSTSDPTQSTESTVTESSEAAASTTASVEDASQIESATSAADQTSSVNTSLQASASDSDASAEISASEQSNNQPAVTPGDDSTPTGDN